MNITNKYNLPEAIYKAVSEGIEKPKENLIRITQLINPAWQFDLYKKHFNELEEDASDRLRALSGTSKHYILQNYAPKESITLKRFSCLFWYSENGTNGKDIEVSGEPDLYYNGIIEDYKETSVWSIIYKNTIDWERQLNCYAYLMYKNGYEIKELYVRAILRDWMESKKNSENYPPIPFVTVRIPLWTADEQRMFIQNKLIEHFSEIKTICSPEERWERESSYAVMKNGRKSAIKLFDNQIDANEMAIKLGLGHYVDERPSTPTRCIRYCLVNKFCDFYKNIKEK